MSAVSETVSIGQVEHDSSTVKKINSLLNAPKTRVEGLRLLNLFLPHCPQDVFVQFCVTWMQNCCKVDGLTKSWNHSSHLLRNLFETSSKYPELKKSVSFFITTRYFDFFLKHLLNSQSGWFCTEGCLLFYRGACGPFQESLEKQLKNEVEKNAVISSTIGRCFALLPCIGGGGNDGVIYKKNWKNQFLKFLSICHSVLNDLFVDVEELQEYETHGYTHERNENERNVNYLATQFSNYSTILSIMLLNQYPASKAVPSDQIFQLICRGLAPNPRAMAKRQTTEAISLQKVLPEIYCSLFSLLKAVIITCKSQLLPYSHLICKLIKQSLELDFVDVHEKQFKKLRVSTYGVLCDWLAVARNGSCVEAISRIVVASAVSDIQPKQEVVSLKEAKLQNLSKSKEQSIRWINAAAVSRLCNAALRALQFLLKFSGVFLDPELHKHLQEVVVKLLVELQKSSDFTVPFAVHSCRKELYSVLLELTLQPSLKWPPPTNFALRLFSKGLNDSSPEVSSFCSTALNFATIIIHPQYDNGGFPLPSSAEDNNRMREPTNPTEEPMEVENEKEMETIQEETNVEEENAPELKMEKVSVTPPESDILSDEDSRNTVSFTKDDIEVVNEEIKKSEVRKEELLPQPSQMEKDLIANQPIISIEKLHMIPSKDTLPKTPSPKRTPTPRETPESSQISKTRESIRLLESDSSKSISPEPTNEDGQLRGRYFLRSKTKASSEEPEEVLKRTSSPDVAKATPSKSSLKMTPSVPSSAKRPRTRALSKVESNSETEVKKSDGEKTEDNDDEEDIRAAFYDAFID